MAVEDDNLSDETLLEVCRLSVDHEELTPELLEDLKAVRLLVGPRRTADGRLEHAVALLVSALGSFTLHNPRHLPFGYSGPTIRSKDWVAKETVERTLIQIAGLIWTDTAPAVATIVQRAVTQAVALGLAEQSHYDTWEPGMVSGSGWRDVLSATPYGVTKARKLAGTLRNSAAAPQATQTQSEARQSSAPPPPSVPEADDSVRKARRKQLDDEHRAFRKQVSREHDEIMRTAATARTKADVPAILHQLIREISLWTRQLKHETFVLFDDTDDAREHRRMMKNDPGGISLLPGYITLGFSVASDARDLVELAVGSSQAASLASRLQEVDDVRHDFALAVATLASTWDAGDEKDYNAFAQLDEHRSSAKLSAFELCRYIETLAHLVSSRSGSKPAAADSNGTSGTPMETAERPTSPPGDVSNAPAGSADAEDDIDRLMDDANYCLTILGDLRRDFQAMHSTSRRMEGGGEDWHFANSSDEAHYKDASHRSRAQVTKLVEPLGRVLTWGCQRDMEIHDRADLLKVDGSSWQNADQCHAYELDVRAVLNVLLIERTKSARRKDSQPESSPRRDPVMVWLAAETMKSIATGLSLHAILTRMNKPSDYDDRDKMSRDFKLAQKHGYLLVSVARQLSLDPQPLTRVLREDRLWEYPAEKDDVAVFRAVTELAERIITEARVWCAEAGIDPEAALKERLAEPPDSNVQTAPDAATATAKPPSGSSAASSIAHDEIDRATASGPGTDPAPTLKIGRRGDPCFVRGNEKPPLTDAQHELVSALLAAGEAGMKKDQLTAIRSGALMTLRTLREGDSDWAAIIQMAGKTNGRYRIRQ